MTEPEEKSFVLKEVVRLPPGAADDPFNFINESMTFITRWSRAYPNPIVHGESAYACLVGCERINSDIAGRANCIEQKLFREDTPVDFLSRIYFCSYPFARVFAEGHSLRSLNDCERALEETGLADRPIVFFNAAERRILWRVNKESELRQAIIRPPSVTKLTSDRFDGLLSQFHIEYTETPQGYTKPWYSATKLLTKHDLEAEIRDDLFLFLRHLSSEPLAVLREFYNSAGRTDLLINFSEEKLIYYVELKVLRKWIKNGSGRTAVKLEDQLEWGRKGIAQACSYRRTQKYPGAAYTCCFDAREENQEIQELVELSRSMNVEYRRYFMYSSSDAHHRSLMNQARQGSL